VVSCGGGVRQKNDSHKPSLTIRPLFPQWLRDDLQVIATTLSLDEQVTPDVAVTGASIAVLLAGFRSMDRWRRCELVW